MRHETFSKLLSNMKEHPDQWEQGTYEFENKTAKLAIWTANGLPFFYERRSGAKFSLWQKLVIWKAIRDCTDRKLLLKLENTKPAGE